MIDQWTVSVDRNSTLSKLFSSLSQCLISEWTVSPVCSCCQWSVCAGQCRSGRSSHPQPSSTREARCCYHAEYETREETVAGSRGGTMVRLNPWDSTLARESGQETGGVETALFVSTTLTMSMTMDAMFARWQPVDSENLTPSYHEKLSSLSEVKYFSFVWINTNYWDNSQILDIGSLPFSSVCSK